MTATDQRVLHSSEDNGGCKTMTTEGGRWQCQGMAGNRKRTGSCWAMYHGVATEGAK
jgi:hypothetical protein